MVIQFIKNYLIIIFVILTSTICLNATNLSKDEPIYGDESSEMSLPAIEIGGNYISPKGAIVLSEAKNLIVANLKKDDTKGNIYSANEVNEVTTKEAWENIGVQLYKVDGNYSWINGIAIIKNKKVLEVLPSNSAEAVFFADLDNDHIYEIYSNYFLGSGIISEEVYGFNYAINEAYSLSMRQEFDLHLYIDNGILMVEMRHWNVYDDQNKTTGKVILKDNNNKKELAIE
jgi:hypothetical protein